MMLLDIIKMDFAHNKTIIRNWIFLAALVYIVLQWVLPSLDIHYGSGKAFNIIPLTIVLLPLFLKERGKLFAHTLFPLSVKQAYTLKSLPNILSFVMASAILISERSFIEKVASHDDSIIMLALLFVFVEFYEIIKNLKNIFDKMNSPYFNLLMLLVIPVVILGSIITSNMLVQAVMTIMGLVSENLMDKATYILSVIFVCLIDYLTFLKRKEY